MDSLAVAFLGVIALSSLVQAVFVVGLGRQGRRLVRNLHELQQRIDREIQPSLAHLARVTRNAAEVSDLAVLEARRLDASLSEVAARVEEAAQLAQRLLLRPLRPLTEVAAVLRGLRRGLDVYKRLRNFDRPGRAEKRRRESETDEEHLFI